MKYYLPSSAARGVLLASLVLAGCGGTSTTADGGSDAALEDRAQGDASPQDSSVESGADATADASNDSATDASTPETSADASAPDSSTADSASTDAASADAASTDGARVDAPGPDAAGADAASADSGGTCAVGGDYQVTLMGTTVVFRFAADGTWLAGTSSAGIDSGASIALGSWARSGGNIVVTMGSAGMPGGCTAGQVGTYTVTFSPDCNSMRWGLVMDACMARGGSLDGQTFVRASSSSGDAGVDAARDGSTADAGSGDAGACTLVGDWSQFYVPAMMTVYYRLSAGGTWLGATSAAGLGGGMTIPLGNYAFDGRHLTLSGDPGTSGCPAGAVGQYDVTFSTDCRTATLVATSPDACSARQMALTMSSWNRL